VGFVGQRERIHERAVSADRADPLDSEREWAHERGELGADRLAPLGRKRGSEGVPVWVGADRWGPPVRGHGRARARPSWAGLDCLGRNGFFPFFLNF
jgi:hypothetical protein